MVLRRVCDDRVQSCSAEMVVPANAAGRRRRGFGPAARAGRRLWRPGAGHAAGGATTGRLGRARTSGWVLARGVRLTMPGLVASRRAGTAPLDDRWVSCRGRCRGVDLLGRGCRRLARDGPVAARGRIVPPFARRAGGGRVRRARAGCRLGPHRARGRCLAGSGGLAGGRRCRPGNRLLVVPGLARCVRHGCRRGCPADPRCTRGGIGGWACGAGEVQRSWSPPRHGRGRLGARRGPGVGEGREHLARSDQ